MATHWYELVWTYCKKDGSNNLEHKHELVRANTQNNFHFAEENLQPPTIYLMHKRETVPDACRAHTRLAAGRPHKSSWEFVKSMLVLTSLYTHTEWVRGCDDVWSVWLVGNKSSTLSFSHLRIWWSELCRNGVGLWSSSVISDLLDHRIFILWN